MGDRIHAMYGFQGGSVGYFGSMKNSDGNGGRFGIDIYGSRGIVSIRVLPDDLKESCVQGGGRVNFPLTNRSHPLKHWK